MMFKKLLFLPLFLIAPSIAHAACPSPFTMKDASAVSQNVAAVNDASNNCVFESAAALAVSYSGTLQSAAGASGNGTALTVTGTAAAAITVNCSGCSGGTLINFEGQEDGSNFKPIMATLADGTAQGTTTTTSGFTLWQVSTLGLQQIRARISAYSAGTITVTAHASAIPTTLPMTSDNVTQFGGAALATGTGAGGSGIPRVTISNDSSLAANQSMNEAQINGVTPLMGNGVSGTGAQRVSVASDSTGQIAIAQTTPGTTNAVQTIPGTTGGACSTYLASTASTNATNCKNAAGQVYMPRPINTTTTIYYLRMYNLASAPTCSSSTGFVETIPVPPANAAGGANGIAAAQSFGQAYSTGIGFCLTGGGGNTDNTNAATGVYITLLYK